MLRAPWAAIAAICLASAACILQRGYPCDDAVHCILADVQGRCEPEGWCSYPANDCPGGYRFESRAPDDLGGRCVEDVTDCDAGPCAAQRLVVGDTHACVIDPEGRLWCWGSNVFGQLGVASTAPAERCPAAVELVSVELVSASRQVCARTDDQRLWCWGHNDLQQVDWHAGISAIVRAPLEILDLVSVPTVLDVGPSLSCIASATTVTCWGRLPPGADAPLSIETPAPVTMLATGDAHVCALLVDGRVTCVGDDSAGQLGDGEPSGLTEALVATFPIADARAIDAGPEHTCAVLADDVVCWGSNGAGQVGAPSQEDVVATATSVAGLMPGTFAQLALGELHSCVRSDDGTVQCWGDDASGQLGSSEPGVGANVVALDDGVPIVALEIGAGARHSCARTGLDAVVCWGDNGSLQLGAPSTELTRTHHTIAFDCE